MFNYSALRKWRKRCGLTQKDVANALSLKNHTSITAYEKNGGIDCNRLAELINLFSTHLTKNELESFVAELFNVKIHVTPQPQIDYTEWIEDKNKIIEVLENELKEYRKTIAYAKKNCTVATCVIMKRLKAGAM